MNRSFGRLLGLMLGLSAIQGFAAEYVLRVDGLGCPFCAYGIEKRLRTLDGVKDIEFDIAKGQVILTTEKGVTLNREQIKAKVEEAGFTLRSLRVLEDGSDGTAAP
ncbi:hypothetical protein JCM13664_06530 [Methylothermus subterraneus]